MAEPWAVRLFNHGRLWYDLVNMWRNVVGAVGRRGLARRAACIDCGYLQILDSETLWGQLRHAGDVAPILEEYSELSLSDRQRIRERHLRNFTALSCFKKIDLYQMPNYPLRQDEHARRAYNACLSPRSCPHFFPYSPGHSPKEHLALHDHANRIQEQRRWTAQVWGVFFGIGLAGLAIGLALRPALDNLLKAIFR